MKDEKIAVKSATPVEPQAYELSQLDQITLRIYGRNLFFFRLGPDTDARKVFEHLRQGLSNLLVELPDFGGDILTNGSTSRVRLEYGAEPSINLHYRDLRDDWTAGSFAELETANFPMSRISPMAGSLIGQPGIPSNERAPVTDVVASFIPGGVILGISWHHSFTGVEGRSLFLRCWSKHVAAAAQGDRAETMGLSPKASDRSQLSPPAAEEINFPIWLRLKTSSEEGRPPPQPPADPPKLVGSLWRITASKVTALREAASSNEMQASTNDALCSLAWRCVTRARKAQESFDHDKSMLAVAADVRRRVEGLLPPDYMGNAAVFGSPVATTTDLCADGSTILQHLAILIRKSIDKIDGPSTDKLLRSIAAVENTSEIVWDIDLPGADVMCTNWTKTDLLDHSWGPELGCCAALRLPAVAVPGTCMFLPRPVDGTIEVLMCLTEGQNRALREDAEFTGYLDFVCE